MRMLMQVSYKVPSFATLIINVCYPRHHDVTKIRRLARIQRQYNMIKVSSTWVGSLMLILISGFKDGFKSDHFIKNSAVGPLTKQRCSNGTNYPLTTMHNVKSIYYKKSDMY